MLGVLHFLAPDELEGAGEALGVGRVVKALGRGEEGEGMGGLEAELRRWEGRVGDLLAGIEREREEGGFVEQSEVVESVGS